jgi:hypothetical protein
MDYPRGLFGCITTARSNDLRVLDHRFIFVGGSRSVTYGFLQLPNSEESNHARAEWWLAGFRFMVSTTVFLRLNYALTCGSSDWII